MRRPAHPKSPSESKVGDKILALFARKPRERLTPAEILRRAGLARDELQLVIEALRELCRDGQLVRLKKNHYALADREHLVKGRVHAHPNGYGFLIPENRDLQDLYLNRREMRRVMHGDQVMVRIDRKARGGTESHIVRVLERGQKRLLGTYDELNGKPIVVPMDARISPIALAKAAAKTEKGKVIAVEVSRYGTALSSPEAQIVNIMGDPNDPEVQAQSIIFRFGLSTSFPAEVEREAKESSFNLSPQDLAARTDLREFPIVTIEGPAFGRFLSAALLAFQLLIGLSLCQFIYVWLSLKTLLRSLANHELAGAYGRVRRALRPVGFFPRIPELQELHSVVMRWHRYSNPSPAGFGMSPGPSVMQVFEEEMRQAPATKWSTSHTWKTMMEGIESLAAQPMVAPAELGPSSFVVTAGPVSPASLDDILAISVALVVRDARVGRVTEVDEEGLGVFKGGIAIHRDRDGLGVGRRAVTDVDRDREAARARGRPREAAGRRDRRARRSTGAEGEREGLSRKVRVGGRRGEGELDSDLRGLVTDRGQHRCLVHLADLDVDRLRVRVGAVRDVDRDGVDVRPLRFRGSPRERAARPCTSNPYRGF